MDLVDKKYYIQLLKSLERKR